MTASAASTSLRPRVADVVRPAYDAWLAGEVFEPNHDLAVHDKYLGDVATRVTQPDRAALEAAVVAAHESRDAIRAMPAHARAEVLRHVVGQLRARDEEFAIVLAVEAGKTIDAARGEVLRAIDTFALAAEEATRIGGEVMPLDVSPRGDGSTCLWTRVPIGPCSLITPFNFPLNLVAHKVGPAIAAGCPFILKPAPRTPVSALLIGEILAETDLPRGAWSVLPVSNDDAAPLIEDERLKLLSFTGSGPVGWMLRSKAGRKRVVLELGGNAACIVDRDADPARIVPRIAAGAFGSAGQSCISVQRLLVHEDLYDAVRTGLIEAAEAMAPGDPLDPETTLAPMISEADAMRIETWTGEAVAGGGRVIAGGGRKGVFFDATIVENAPRDSKLEREEAFAPLVTLASFCDFDHALARANDSEYGLQAGVFTRDLHRAYRAFEQLEVGGVVINDIPSSRVDAMPYGGVKKSGAGREGVRFAIEDMTEMKLLLLRDLGKE